MRPNPHLYETNALIFLRRLSQKYGRQLTLATIPNEEWQRLHSLGFDLLWLMGVWERSPGGRRIALAHAGLHSEYARVLPGLTEQDVVGSPYSVHSYRLDPNLGAHDDLGQLKTTLNQQGLGLVLDFVPNHLALDHPWTVAHPDRFVHGNGDAVRAHPRWFFQTEGGNHLAHGRDPYFPPWTDTVQVNFFSPDLREALVHELLSIAEVADGVRCDMAMLALNSVFEKVWGDFISDLPRPDSEFWAETIQRVKQQRPDFLFLAEAYWDLEKTLLDLGFDYAYDKTLYDRLRHSSIEEVRRYLEIPVFSHRQSVKFIENHDESRAVTALGRGKSRAAATVMSTVPGLHLFHDGQLEGKQVRLPVQLGREPDEPFDPQIVAFYQRLLAVCDAPAFHEGEWGMLAVAPAWGGNATHYNLLVWAWHYVNSQKVVVVNYAASPSQGRVKLAFPPGVSGSVVLRDELNSEVYVRDSTELQNHGLYVELGPWQAHILDVLDRWDPLGGPVQGVPRI